jgi:hypothetical protein
VHWLLRIALGLLGLAVLAVLLLFGGVGPIAFLPGGHLWGEVAEPRDDWSFTDAIGEIQLQTHVGPLPWSVTTWVLADDAGDLYVAAGDCDRVWTHRVLADPEIRLRIDGVVYEMHAMPEASREVGATIAPVVLAKYMGIAAETANWIPGATNGCVFRVEPRP